MINKATRNGFTLTELVVAMAIVGILSAIAIPKFQQYSRKAKQVEAGVQLSQIAMAEGNFFGLWGQYTTDLKAAGFEPTGTIIYIAGFPGNVPWSSGTASTRYPTSPTLALNGNRNDSHDATVCLPALCTYKGSLTALASSGAVNPNAAGVYTAAAQANLKGTVTDTWTMTSMKVFKNTADGTL